MCYKNSHFSADNFLLDGYVQKKFQSKLQWFLILCFMVALWTVTSGCKKWVKQIHHMQFDAEGSGIRLILTSCHWQSLISRINTSYLNNRNNPVCSFNKHYVS